MLLQILAVSVGVMMNNVWDGCYHYYLVDAVAAAAAAFWAAQQPAVSALNLALQVVTAEAGVVDAVVEYYQFLCTYI